jgi:hypothetical protein
MRRMRRDTPSWRTSFGLSSLFIIVSLGRAISAFTEKARGTPFGRAILIALKAQWVDFKKIYE